MLRRVLYVCILVLVAGSALGWDRIPTVPQPTWSFLDVTRPTSPRHPLNRGLIAHWQVLPQTNYGGGVWRSTAPLVPPLPGTVTGMGPNDTSAGWRPTRRTGGFGEMRIPGGGGYIDLGVNTVGLRMHGAAGVTIALWVKWAFLTGTDNLCVSIFGPANSAALRLGFPSATPGQVAMGGRSIWSDAFQQVTSTATLASATWVYLVGVVDYPGQTMTLYVNGKLDATFAATFSNTTYDNNTPSTTPDLLGATIVGSYEFVGAMDDVRIMGRAMTDVEVAALYDATSSVHNPTLQWLASLVVQPSGALAVKPRRGGAY